MLVPAVTIALVLSCQGASGEVKPLAFTQVADGIEHTSFEVKSPYVWAGHAFRIDLEKVELHMLGTGKGRRVVEEIAASIPVHLAVNASFFDETNKAMGRVTEAGHVASADRRGPWGALIVENRKARIALGESLPLNAPGGDLVVQGIPRLVINGTVPKLKPAAAPRTAVCADASQLIVVVTTDPADTTGFARFLARKADKGGLGCTDALNLDGGPSTQLHARLPSLSLDVKGGWGVPNALVIVPRALPASPQQPTSNP